MKLILKLFLLVIVLIILAGGYGAYAFGLIGTPKPKDLGIEYTEADWQMAEDKTQVKTETVSQAGPETALKYSGSHPVKQSFSSAEITAAANHRAWKYLPFKNIQVRLNTDGTAEVSGNINTAMIADYLVAVGGLSAKEAQLVKDYVPVRGNPSFYLKAGGSVKNNHISLDLQSVKVGPVNVPGNYIDQYQPEVVKFLNDRLPQWEGMQVDSLDFDDGKMNFSGNLPDTEIVAR